MKELEELLESIIKTITTFEDSDTLLESDYPKITLKDIEDRIKVLEKELMNCKDVNECRNIWTDIEIYFNLKQILTKLLNI